MFKLTVTVEYQPNETAAIKAELESAEKLIGELALLGEMLDREISRRGLS